MSGASLFSLTMEFNEVVHTVKEFGSEIIHLMIADSLSAAVGGLIGATLVHRLQERKTRKAILDGNFENDHAVFGDTTYFPSGKINTLTGEEFIDQRVRTIVGDVELEKIFPPPHNITLMEYIMKASKHCTLENPIVFSHLDKVIKDPNELDKVKQTIGQCWTNYFSHLLGGNLERVKTKAGERRVPVEEVFVPVLTLEQNAAVKKFRIFLMSGDQLLSEKLPDPRNVRVEVKGEFVYDPEHNYMQRRQTYGAIADLLNSPEGKWIKDWTTIREPMGEYMDVAPVLKI